MLGGGRRGVALRGWKANCQVIKHAALGGVTTSVARLRILRRKGFGFRYLRGVPGQRSAGDRVAAELGSRVVGALDQVLVEAEPRYWRSIGQAGRGASCGPRRPVYLLGVDERLGLVLLEVAPGISA